MPITSLVSKATQAIPLVPVLQKDFKLWLESQPVAIQRWLKTNNFKADPFTFCSVADVSGNLKQVIVGVASEPDFFALAHLPMVLPEGDYRVDDKQQVLAKAAVELGWGMAAYQFTTYKKAKRVPAQLLWRKNSDQQAITNLLTATYLVRDLINTPAEGLNTEQLARAAKKVAQQFKAEFKEIIGEKLLTQNYPAIYTVGRASVNVPRLIDIRWGNRKHKKITLVGKGVCFDTGGLNIKGSDGMADMKKDMGGAAHVLALAYLIMAAKLPVCLRVLIPAVENSISGNAYRPGDVIQTRKGLSVEIGNTDAEGRLILCDAIAEAVTEQPDLLIDFATLTGAARVAVGSEISAFFTNRPMVAEKLQHAAQNTCDPAWQLPLYKNYRSLLNSEIADINNASSSKYGGAITAALFLQEFVPNSVPWVHFDIMASNASSHPGRPKGGEAMGLRASFEYINNNFK